MRATDCGRYRRGSLHEVWRVLPEWCGSIFHGLLASARICQAGDLSSFAQLVFAVYEDPHAPCAEEADDQRSDRTAHVTGVLEGFGHGQYAGSQASFHQVEEGFHITRRKRISKLILQCTGI